MSMLYRDGEHLGSELRLQDLVRSGSLAAQHGLEHHAGDVSLQAAARLPAAHPLGALALHVGDRRRMHTRLRDGDHVDGGVEAAVAAAIESMARRLARGDRQGRRADVHGKGGLAGKARGAGHLTDELGGRERRAAGKGEQLRGKRAHHGADLALQGADLGGQFAAAPGLLESDAAARVRRDGLQRLRDAIEPHVPVEHPGRQLEVDLELPPRVLDRYVWLDRIAEALQAVSPDTRRRIALEQTRRCRELTAEIRALEREIRTTVSY